MPTLRRRTLVSLATTMAAVSMLGACVQAASNRDGPPSPDDGLPFRFENGGREYVHVYLIGETREWRLGRIEPGAVAVLRIPEESIAERAAFVRLAVIAGERVTLQAARHPRARLTVAQPASAILSQHWKFSQGSLTSLRR